MSQAAVDLPDHLDKSADPLANPDDLLSQMAGNEIDRLLAEADVKPALAAAAPPAKVAPTEEASVSSQLDNLFDEMKAQEKGANGAGAPPASNAALTAAVDAELAEKGADVVPKGAEREAMLHAAGFEDGADHAANAPADSAAPEGTERSSLLTAAGFESDADADESAEDDSAPEWVEPLPVYLKPLQWINAPMESCPDHVREILGKLGIVTMVNALAVLGYLLIFRKH